MVLADISERAKELRVPAISKFKRKKKEKKIKYSERIEFRQFKANMIFTVCLFLQIIDKNTE